MTPNDRRDDQDFERDRPEDRTDEGRRRGALMESGRFEGDFAEPGRRRPSHRNPGPNDWQEPRFLGNESVGRRFGVGSRWNEADEGRDIRDTGHRPREFGFGNSQESRGEFAGRGPKDYRRSDERLREDVCDRLTDDPSIDASEIRITVKDGDVTLEGTVSDRRAKRAAEDCVESVSGVQQVDNRLRVEMRGSTQGATGPGNQGIGTHQNR